jgi:hypothetical protein
MFMKPSDPTILNLSVVKKNMFRIVGSLGPEIYVPCI